MAEGERRTEASTRPVIFPFFMSPPGVWREQEEERGEETYLNEKKRKIRTRQVCHSDSVTIFGALHRHGTGQKEEKKRKKRRPQEEGKKEMRFPPPRGDPMPVCHRRAPGKEKKKREKA